MAIEVCLFVPQSDGILEVEVPMAQRTSGVCLSFCTFVAIAGSGSDVAVVAGVIVGGGGGGN